MTPPVHVSYNDYLEIPASIALITLLGGGYFCYHRRAHSKRQSQLLLELEKERHRGSRSSAADGTCAGVELYGRRSQGGRSSVGHRKSGHDLYGELLHRRSEVAQHQALDADAGAMASAARLLTKLEGGAASAGGSGGESSHGLERGETVFYQHEDKGFVPVQVLNVLEGGALYLVGGPSLGGRGSGGRSGPIEVEVVRRKLFRTRPEWSPQGHWVEPKQEGNLVNTGEEVIVEDATAAEEGGPASGPPPAPLPPSPADDLAVGDVVYYRHRSAGWILVKVLKIDREGAFDGGLTFVIGGAPQLNGAEVETTRDRLNRALPD